MIKNEENETIKKIDLITEDKNITRGADPRREDAAEIVLPLWIRTVSRRKVIDKDRNQAIGIKNVRIIIINNN